MCGELERRETGERRERGREEREVREGHWRRDEVNKHTILWVQSSLQMFKYPNIPLKTFL